MAGNISQALVWGMPHVLAGTTPCNNNTGNNRGGKSKTGETSKTGAGRDGLEGRDSKLFGDFVGIFEKLARIIEQRAGPSGDGKGKGPATCQGRVRECGCIICM